MIDYRSFAIAGLLTTAVASPLVAQTFDVKAPDVEKGSVELGFDNTFHAGVPRQLGSDVNRRVHEQSIDWGILSWWKLSGVLKLEKPEEDQFRANAVAIENLLVLKAFDEKRPFDLALGWFTGVDISINNETTNAVLFGPILGLKADKLTLMANPFFERTFGRNSDDGIAFNYAWHAKYELREGFAVGIEGFGVIDDIGNAPAFEDQEHRIGPAIFTELNLGNGVTIAPDVGLLFGLTRATPDVALKFNVGVPLYKLPAKNGD